MLVAKTAHFSIGQIIYHRTLHFRGVIIDIDFYFLSYQNECKPSKIHNEHSSLWYHILIDNTPFQIYAPESDIRPSASTNAIIHPAIEFYFLPFKSGIYQSKILMN